MDSDSTLALVLLQSGGALRVPIRCAARILGLQVQTIRNRLVLGTWPLHRHIEGRRVYFDAREIAAMIDCGLTERTASHAPAAPRRGRPYKSLRAQRCA